MSEHLKPAIKEIVKVLRKYGMDYEQTAYVFKQARKQTQLRPKKRQKKGTVERLSEEEINRFLDQAYGRKPKIGLMMSTLYQTAARVSEFVALEIRDVYADEQRIVIRKGKGDKRREVPIVQELARKLQIHIGQRKSGPLFLTLRQKAYSQRMVQHLTKEIALEAELQHKVSPHILRHTRATLLAEAGMSKDHLQIFLGHEKPETTQIYTHTAAIDMKKAFRLAIENNQNASKK